MRKSIALGFWTCHADAMDMLCEYDWEDLEQEARDSSTAAEMLVSAISDETDRELLNDIRKIVQSDVQAFNTSVAELIINKLPVGFASSKQRSGGFWADHEIFISQADGRKAKGFAPMRIGWNWHTQNNQLHLRPWAWGRGGRSTERQLYELLKNNVATATPASEAGGNWSSGTLTLSPVELSTSEALEFQLDLDELAAKLLTRFDWIQDPAILQGFVELGRGKAAKPRARA